MRSPNLIASRQAHPATDIHALAQNQINRERAREANGSDLEADCDTTFSSETAKA